jgi:hypothetical protein
MEFTIPQFTDYEAKVIGPFSFKQFIIVAVAGVICIVAILKLPVYIYVPVCLIVGGGSMVIVFVKIGGFEPLTVLKNWLNFTTSSNIYIWRRRKTTPQIIIKKEELRKEEEIGPAKIVRQSKLRELSTQIETKN